MSSAGGIAIVSVAVLACWSAAGGSQPTVSGAGALLPFSAVYSPDSGQEQQLRRAIEALDAVASADVTIAAGGEGRRVAIIVRWSRPVRPDTETIDFIQRLVLHLVPQVRPSDILIADQSGQVWAYGGAAFERHRRPHWPAMLAGLAIVSAGCAALVLLWRRPRYDEDQAGAPAWLQGLTPDELARLLADASPAVRGAVLCRLPEPMRGRVARRVSAVQTPDSPPPVEIIAAIVQALRDAHRSKLATIRGERNASSARRAF